MPPLSRSAQRLVRHRRLRRRVAGTRARPRLAVFRSLQHTYVQIVDDGAGVTLAAACTREAEFPAGSKAARAEEVGRRIAQRALGLNITRVVFDRGGLRFHGRVKALAEAARKGGLQF